jgi:hypothetical protein
MGSTDAVIVCRNAVLPPVPPADNVWQSVFWEITKPRENACSFDAKVHAHRRLILAEVIRLKWDSRFKIKGIDRQSKKEIKAAGNVAFRLLNLIAEVHLMRPDMVDHQHPAQWFLLLMAEGEAIGVNRPPGLGGGKNFKRALSNENRLLYSLSENPFTLTHTERFFDAALKLAWQYDRFAAVFREYVKARRQLSSVLTEGGSKVQRKTAGGKSKPYRQGRKKVDSENLTAQGFQEKKTS